MTEHTGYRGITFPISLFPTLFHWRVLIPSVLVMTAFTMIVVVARMVAAVLPPQADIFALYEPLFPGADETLFNQYPCVLYDVTYGPRRVTCVITQENGVFRQVSVFTEAGKVTGINFRSRNLRLVDLMGQWGKPDRFYRVGRIYKAEWERQVNITAELGRLYSSQSPVRLISISRMRVATYGPRESYLCFGKFGNLYTKQGCNFPPVYERQRQ